MTIPLCVFDKNGLRLLIKANKHSLVTLVCYAPYLDMVLELDMFGILQASKLTPIYILGEL